MPSEQLGAQIPNTHALLEQASLLWQTSPSEQSPVVLSGSQTVASAGTVSSGSATRRHMSAATGAGSAVTLAIVLAIMDSARIDVPPLDSNVGKEVGGYACGVVAPSFSDRARIARIASECQTEILNS